MTSEQRKQVILEAFPSSRYFEEYYESMDLSRGEHQPYPQQVEYVLRVLLEASKPYPKGTRIHAGDTSYTPVDEDKEDIPFRLLTLDERTYQYLKKALEDLYK
jgi:hypothetical protein